VYTSSSHREVSVNLWGHTQQWKRDLCGKWEANNVFLLFIYHFPLLAGVTYTYVGMWPHKYFSKFTSQYAHWNTLLQGEILYQGHAHISPNSRYHMHTEIHYCWGKYYTKATPTSLQIHDTTCTQFILQYCSAKYVLNLFWSSFGFTTCQGFSQTGATFIAYINYFIWNWANYHPATITIKESKLSAELHVAPLFHCLIRTNLLRLPQRTEKIPPGS